MGHGMRYLLCSSAGEGIVLLRNGFILGCDNQYFYEGRFEVDGDGGFRALVTVSHYAGDRAVCIFGEFGPSATTRSAIGQTGVRPMRFLSCRDAEWQGRSVNARRDLQMRNRPPALPLSCPCS
jgi:T3SS negative regulator,GrlR